MPNRVCDECGTTFFQEEGRRARVVCSDDCRLARSRRKASEWHHANYVPVEPKPKLCTIPGCERPSSGSGVCGMHRARFKRHGVYDLPEVLCAACGTPMGRYGSQKLICVECRPEYRRRSSQQWKASNPALTVARRRRERLARYGLTEAVWEAMMTEQAGACAICRDPYDPTRKRHWHIDHDRESGQVRGLLCRRCNQEIGKFNHDPVLLRAAADYLVRAQIKAVTPAGQPAKGT